MERSKKEKINGIIEKYRNGSMIIVTDDDDRENEGDLMISSQFATVEAISFMAQYGRGLICLPIEQSVAERLNMPLMWDDNDSQYSTAFTISVDASDGTTTGISAHDRLKTIQTVIDGQSKAEDLLRPGHLFPLIAHEGGLKKRRGHTEAAVELGRFVGHVPSGVICEIMGDDGKMTRGDALEEFAEEHGLPMLTIEELVEYMFEDETASTYLPTEYGDFLLYHFESDLGVHMPHIAMVHKEADLTNPVVLRVHSECLTGDLFGSLRCDCGDQLKKSLEIINDRKGILIYLRQEGRGIGLVKKMEAYRLQDKGIDTVDANLQLGLAIDNRDYKTAGDFLHKVGVTEVELITNNPEKLSGLEQSGIKVSKRLSLETTVNRFNRQYLATKKNRMNHILNLKEVI